MKLIFNALTILFIFAQIVLANEQSKPNIVLIMSDDQGWGQTGYNNHPILKTPNIDAMAKNGLRFNQFYAGAPVCSPTRASVLTGRANDRTGVTHHGFALRLQEKTIAPALKKLGYATGHFGKWHLNGLRGPGVPVLKNDSHNPRAFGFDTWLTVTNFFDMDPLMGREGKFEQMKGDSSKVIVNEALKFITKAKESKQPFFAVIWDGSPHSPWKASEEDIKDFKHLDKDSQHHYGELVAFDRSIGTLRKGLRDLKIADNTLVWFCSDNGGLPKITPETVGGLKGFKGAVSEGGLRVPGIIEWPARIKARITNYPASTMDIFPTIADILKLPETTMLKPIDGDSLLPIFTNDLKKRETKIPFRFSDSGALVDNHFKLVFNGKSKTYSLYNLNEDIKESTDIAKSYPDVFQNLKASYEKWNSSVEDSVQGKDYAEGFVLDNSPIRKFWMADKRYFKYKKEWKNKWEYKKYLSPKFKNRNKKKK